VYDGAREIEGSALTKDTRQDAPAVRAAFLRRYLEDAEQGAVKPLGDYQAMFPGYEEVIAGEHARIEKDADTIGLPAGAAPRASSGASVSREVLGPGRDPRQIGVYRILDVLGEGGMGVVYVAEQTEPIRRRVALKVIKLGMDTREVIARFEAERQALALMNHPHIARVYDAGATDQGRPFFVMEHVPGIPLTRFCDQHQLTMRQRLEIFLQVCHAVQHAHQKGIIHRDLKPSNVLVAYEDGRAVSKIIDFGVAKSTNHRLTEQTVFTEQGQIIGTPEYMSPEQAEMSALDVDTRTDIYSLGVILYEMLAGALPFDSRELRQAGYLEIQRRIREVDPPTPSTRLSRLGPDAAAVAERRRSDVRALVRELRGDLDWITMKAMEKDRQRRYASSSELAADIRRHLDHEPVLAFPPGPAYRFWKFARKHRVALGALASVLLLLAAGWSASRYLGAKRLHAEGIASLEEHRRLKGELASLEEGWRKARDALEAWQPVWERGDEIAAWQKLEQAREEVWVHLDRAVLALQKGLDTAFRWSPDRRRIQAALEDLYFERYLEVLRGGGGQPRPEFFRMMVGSMGPGGYSRRLERGKVSFITDPPGADVYCFRHEEIECRRVPLPFDPARGLADARAGIIGKPFLLVEAVRDPGLSPFRPGDRLLEVGGRAVSTWSDLAAAAGAASTGQEIEVELIRDGSEMRARWTPFPGARYADAPAPLRAGRVIDIRDQFGFLPAGYPLDLVEGARVGTTGAGAPLEVELPRGSYLFVFRKAGRADARFPVAVPAEEEPLRPGPERVRLLAEEELPPGFVYVPAGPTAAGGDREVDQDLPGGSYRVPGFFMSRLEVTVGEYLEFLNSREILEETLDENDPARAREKKIRLVPYDARGLLFVLDGRWKAGRLGDHALPIILVSNEAAQRYAAWLTEKRGRRWTFRLPSDLEWEKAARGADRRFHVWGNYVVWSFCRSLRGSYLGKSRPEPVGSYPFDESVFGVRDMAGSVCEPTTGETIPGFTSLRGGDWDEPTPYYYRIANREGRLRARSRDQGIRLVADLPAS
jgi:serine/threonine protein kinase/formylglycine-generating enzyme required for sulfatase activity